MYEREHQYDKIIDCYLRDPLREVSYETALPFFSYSVLSSPH